MQGFYTCLDASSATINAKFVELKCSGADIYDGKDGNKSLSTIAIGVLNNDYPKESYRFRIGNFNGKQLTFQLLNEYGALVQFGAVTAYTTPWILVLNMTGVEDEQN